MEGENWLDEWSISRCSRGDHTDHQNEWMPGRMGHSESGFMETTEGNHLNLSIDSFKYLSNYLLGTSEDTILAQYLP